MTTKPSKQIDTFDNPQPERDFTIRIDVPEFTCLCPMTGQPDFAHLVVDWYLPKVREPHGPEWMAVMIYFGRVPVPFHDMKPTAQKRGRAAVAAEQALLFEAPHGRR